MAEELPVRITATDATGTAFDSVARRASATAASFDKFRGRIDQMVKATDEQKKSFEGLVTASGYVAAGLGAAGAAVTAWVLTAKKAADVGDALNDLSKKTGIAVEQLSTYRLAAEMSGTSLEGLASGIKFLGKSMIEAADPSKESALAFAQMGVSLKDAAGQAKSTEQVFLEVSDRFKSLPDGAAKSTLAMQLFGRAGVDLIPILNEGSASIRQMQAESVKLGQQWSGPLAQQADAFNDQMAKMKAGFNGITETIGQKLIPSVQEWAFGVTLLEQDIVGMLKHGIIPYLMGVEEESSKVSISIGGVADAVEKTTARIVVNLEEVKKQYKTTFDYAKELAKQEQAARDRAMAAEKKMWEDRAEIEKKNADFELEMALAAQRWRVEAADAEVARSKEVQAAVVAAETEKLALLEEVNRRAQADTARVYDSYQEQISDTSDLFSGFAVDMTQGVTQIATGWSALNQVVAETNTILKVVEDAGKRTLDAVSGGLRSSGGAILDAIQTTGPAGGTVIRGGFASGIPFDIAPPPQLTAGGAPIRGGIDLARGQSSSVAGERSAEVTVVTPLYLDGTKIAEAVHKAALRGSPTATNSSIKGR